MENRVEKMRVKNSKSNTVHSVHSWTHHPIPCHTNYYTMCGAKLNDYPGLRKRFLKTKDPVTCKTCLKVLGALPAESKKTSLRDCIPWNQVKSPEKSLAVLYIATLKDDTIYSTLRDLLEGLTLHSADTSFVADSLPDLLRQISRKFDNSNYLVKMLENGEFSFYKAKDIDIQVEVQVTKKVVSLKEC